MFNNTSLTKKDRKNIERYYQSEIIRVIEYYDKTKENFYAKILMRPFESKRIHFNEYMSEDFEIIDSIISWKTNH